MANGEENRKVDKTDLQIARERLDVQRELAGLKSKSTSDEKFNLSITNKLVNLAQNHLDIEKEREALTRNSKDVANDLLKVEKNRDRILKSIKTTTGKEKTLLQDSLELNQQIINALEKEEKSVKKIEKSFGIAGSSLKVINKLLGGQIPELDKIQEKTRERLAKLEKQNKLLGGTAGKFQALRIQVSEVGKAIGRNILDPIVLIKAGLDYSQQLAELQRGLGLSNVEARNLRAEASSIASETGNIAVQSKDVLKAINELNQQFGAAASNLRDDIVSEMAKLGKLTNLSAEAQGRFAMFANISGKNAAVITKETRRAVVNAEQERGLRVDINKTLDEAGKITGQIAAQLDGNVTKIASAITVAKQFGMTLEGVAKAGAQLLNFEESISNELEAELLIGKQINLERARLAALTGDYETLTKEINKNIGDFGDFTKMNVLQQNALAKSVGMTSDELSDVLLKNENIEALAQKARLAGDDDLAKQLEARSAQEKFLDLVDKLKGLFVDIVGGPLSGILNLFADILSTVGKVVQFLGLGQGGMADFVVKGAIFGKILFSAFGLTKKMVLLMKSMKLQQLGINVAEKIGLINKQAAIRARGRLTALAATEGNTEKLNNIHKNAGLGTLIKQNIQRGLANVKLKLQKGLLIGKNVIQGIYNTLKGTEIGLQAASNRKGVFGLLRQAGQFVLGMFSAGAKAPFPLSVVLPFILGGIAGAIGATLVSKFSKGDDVVSPGYGKRMLSMPEGTVALNDNDFVTASTNDPRGGIKSTTQAPVMDMTETNDLLKENIAMNAEVAKRTGSESVWSKGNENLGNKANADVKYGNVNEGFS
jgi:hypothetical protein